MYCSIFNKWGIIFYDFVFFKVKDILVILFVLKYSIFFFWFSLLFGIVLSFIFFFILYYGVMGWVINKLRSLWFELIGGRFKIGVMYLKVSLEKGCLFIRMVLMIFSCFICFVFVEKSRMYRENKSNSIILLCIY